MKRKNIFFSSHENSVFDKIRQKNKSDLGLWNLTNTGFPLFTFIITFLIFSYTDKTNNIDSFLSILFSGALPLTAINIMIASSFFLIKFNKDKEGKHGLSTSNTRLRLIIYAFISYLFSSSLFVIQNIYNPFNNWWARGTQLLYSILAIWIAMVISNRLFLLQEEMIDKSYDKIIGDNAKRIQQAL